MTTATTTTTGRENNKKVDRGGAGAQWLLPPRAIAPLMSKEWYIQREIEMDSYLHLPQNSQP